MPIFKPKNTKKIVVNQNSIVTLDGKHTEMVERFENDENIVIPKLISEKKQLLLKLSKDYLTFDEKLEIEDKISLIKKNIKDIKIKKKNYYLDNSKYIFDYF